MKVSRAWLQKYFEKELPAAQALAEALTFHAFEVESITTYEVVDPIDQVLDVKVTPNRGHDCLSHRGIAKELSAILNIPMKADPLREAAPLEPKTSAFKVSIENGKLCRRFTGALIKGIKVGPSPEWLRAALESIGQKSINNVVDATNYVMFDIGQPLHAFDAGKLTDKEGYALDIRSAKKGEKMLGLDDKEYALGDSMLAIADAHTGEAVSIAGIKGGKPTGIDEATTTVILEAANWDGVTIRKTSQALKLRTDASDRFQQVISPELAPRGLLAAAKLIVELAGGTVEGYVDEYPDKQEPWTVAVSTKKVNAVLGTNLGDADVSGAFRRLDLPCEQKGGELVVAVPFERLDLTLPEDLIEEVARIVGYDNIPAVELPPFPRTPEVNPDFCAAEKAREELVSQGYSEVFTSVFVEHGFGERAVLNKVGGEKPYLRESLIPELQDALGKNMHNKDLLGLKEIKLFEIGTVWRGGKEQTMVATVAEQEVQEEKPLEPISASDYGNLPTSTLERYRTFSKYPFIVRDIAMWMPQSEQAFSEAIAVFAAHNRGLLRHVELFDQFKKGERQSYAFHLVFQSFDKTLTDEEANSVMDEIYTAVKAKGWEVR